MSAPIFISYSSKDRDIAETLCEALEARGLECWISCRDVNPGQNFQEAIVRALRSAQIMLLVFTANANNSDEIKKELVLAGRHRVTVVPIRVEDVVPNDAFAYEFATRQWVDLFKDWEREIERLAVRLGEILLAGKPPEGAEAEAATVAVARRRVGGGRQSGRGIAVASAVVAVLLVIGAAVFYLRPFARAPSAEPPLPQQTAAAPPGPAAAPSPPPPEPLPAASPSAQAAAPPSPPELPSAPPAATPSPDEAAWQTATAANTITAFNDYLKASPAGAYVEEAQLKIADLIFASPAKSKAYDGKWLTRLSCPTAGRAQGYSMEFSAEVKDGAYRARVGNAGEAGSLAVDGKIVADGTAAFLAKGFIGSSTQSGGGSIGAPYSFHALAQFEPGSGAGKRIEFRPCNLTFAKQ